MLLRQSSGRNVGGRAGVFGMGSSVPVVVVGCRRCAARCDVVHAAEQFCALRWERGWRHLSLLRESLFASESNPGGLLASQLRYKHRPFPF